MARTYLLVDFENVQPSTLGTHLRPDSAESFVKVFAGEHQNRIDLSLAQALQPFGTRAEYIQVVGTGKDALDFHIAYYLGRLSVEHPGSTFIILSKDTGFDPLLKHLAQHDVVCKRVRSIDGKAPAAKSSPTKATAKVVTKPVAKATVKVPKKVTVARPATPPDTPQRIAAKDVRAVPAELALPAGRLEEIVQRLTGLKGARPATVKTLQSSMMAWFKPALTAAQMDTVVQQLQAQGLLKVNATKVAYALTARPK